MIRILSQKFCQFFWENTFNKNILTLITGSVMAQAIPLLVSPILTRLYRPVDFGLFSLYLSIVMVLRVVICGRYEYAIILPKEDSSAKNLVFLSLLICFVFGLFLWGMILFFGQELNTWNAQINQLGSFIVFSTMFVGIYLTLYFWFNRKKQYNYLTWNRIGMSIVIAGSSVLFGFFSNLLSTGLVLSYFVGQIFCVIFLLSRAQKEIHPSDFSWIEIKRLFHRYIDFPKFQLLSSFVEKLANQSPVFFLAWLYGPSVVGFYGLAYRVCVVPVSLISQSVSDVLRQQAREVYAKEGHCEALILDTFKKLFIIAIVPFFILLIFGPFLFRWVFGFIWNNSGIYSQIMSVLFFMQFIVGPLSVMFVVAEKQKYDLWLQIYLIIVVSVGVLVGKFWFNNEKFSIAFFVVGYVSKYLIEFYLSYRFSLGNRNPVPPNDGVN